LPWELRWRPLAYAVHLAREQARSPAWHLIRRDDVKRLTLALLLFATSTSAQDVEHVTVYGVNLSGFWQTESPGWFRMSMFGNVTWGPLRQVWCRIGYSVTGYVSHCYRGDASVVGQLEQDARHFQLAGGAFVGEVTSATTYEGHHAIKVLGVSVATKDLEHGRKETPMPDAADNAGKREVVRGVLGGQAVAHDASLEADIAGARSLKLGKLQSISFLGRQMMPGKDGPDTPADQNYLAAYAVQFSDGEAICWVHQDENGKLAAFRCV